MKQTFEELIGICPYSHNFERNTEVVPKFKMIKLLKQVREATIQECINKIQIEHRVYDVDGTYKSELLGEEMIYDLSEPWNYFATNVKKLNNLDKDSIEI